jgi:hypothetical protein
MEQIVVRRSFFICEFYTTGTQGQFPSHVIAPAKKQLLLAATKLKGAEKDNFDLTSIKLAFDNTSDELLKGTDTSESTAFHVSTSFTNSSFTKKVGFTVVIARL